MAKTYILSLLVLILLITSCHESTSHIEKDTERFELKGNVNSYKEISYEAIIVSGKVQKGDRLEFEEFMGMRLPPEGYDNRDKIKNISFNKEGLMTYFQLTDVDDNKKSGTRYKIITDKDGYITEKHLYDTYGSLKSSIFYEYYKGNLIKQHEEDSEGYLSYKKIFKYENNNITEENHYDSYGFLKFSTSYIYDNKGNLLKQYEKDSEGNLSYQKEYEYKNGEKANLHEVHYNSNAIQTSQSLYTYNEDKVTKKHREIFIVDLEAPRGSSFWKKVRSIELYKYDDKGNLIEKRHKDLDTGIVNITTYEYEYDSKGNWITQIEYRYGEPKYICERTITYYD